jgi:hypothetical protein
MENFTGNGWVILGLVLVVGWLLGLMSRSGGGKWKAEYERERTARQALRKDHETLLKQRVVIPATETQPVKTGAF